MWTWLAGACGLFCLAVNDGLVLTAVKGSAPATPLRPLALGHEAPAGGEAGQLYNAIGAPDMERGRHCPAAGCR
jgi:hypothetical protein